jgi:protein involved in polysaccharide export with SLBB domain
LTSLPNHEIHAAKEALQREPPPLPRELAKEPLPPYVVEPGDVLLVQPIDFDSPLRLPGDQPVMLDGTIDLGRHGRIVVAGRTLDEIEAIIRATIAAGAKEPPGITVRLVNRTSKVFYVLGEVNAPGAYPLTGRETVLDGILCAGGLTDSAARNRITLARPTHPHSCRMVLPVCYQEIVQLGDTTTNYQLAPGDRIFVPSSCGWSDMFGLKKHSPCGKSPAKPCVLPACGCAEEGPTIHAPRNAP